MRFRPLPLDISHEYDSSTIVVTTLTEVRNRSLSWSDARRGRIPLSMVLQRPMLHQLPQIMIILLAFSYYRYAVVSSIAAVADAFHIVTQPNSRIMVRPSSPLIPMRHQYHTQSPRFSLPSKTIPRFMVNFGPYGDYLNRKVNDDDSSNKNSNDDSSNKNKNEKDTMFDPNHPPPHMTSHQNIHYDHHRSNVRFVHQSGSDDLYYYYQTEETLTTEKDDNSSGDWNNPTTPFPTAAPSSSSSSQNQWIPSSPSSHSLLLQSSDSMDTDMAAGTYRILQVPTTSLKPGGLRLFLVMYLLGATPKVHSKLPLWKVDRPSNDEYVIDLYFHDHSAILSIELVPPVLHAEGGNNHARASLDDDDNDSNHGNMSTTNDGGIGMIYIHRIGSSPSFMYRLHEATLLQGLLHELQTCATDPNILVENRLCTWTNTTLQQLQTISSALPFG